MAMAASLVGLAEAKQTWFWASAASIALVLLLLNVLILVAVHARRIRQAVRTRRTRRFRAHTEESLAALRAGEADPQRFGKEVAGYNELERPIAAMMLIEQIRPASEEERKHELAVLREAGVVDQMIRSTHRWMPWRRALAVRTLGWIGAEEAVQALIERSSDRNRYVRESAVRALGRIGDSAALGRLAGLFRAPGPVGTGVVYDSLIGIGADAEPVFAHGLTSPVESVRVASCFGVAALAAPEDARRLLHAPLSDEAPAVRAAAAEGFAQVGGASVPEPLARTTRDDQRAVRRAAVRALGSIDDPRAVELAAAALADPDREVAIRAAESLVRLSRLDAAAAHAAQALQDAEADWPVERASTLAALGAV